MASPIEARAPIKCDDPKTGIAPFCWNSLKVGDYMEGWHKANVPKTCKKDEYWSVCFDRMATSNFKQDCTGITSSCEELDPKIHYLSPQWYYGAFNTWSINDFFKTWHKAIDTVSKKNPATLVDAATPNDFDTFLGAQNNGKISVDVPLNALVRKAGKNAKTDALAALIKAYPAKAKYDSAKIEKADPPIATHLKMRLEELLKIAETNLDAFVDFASNGTFSLKPRDFAAESLVDLLYPEGRIMVSID
ncbi:MAG: hypothetical protein LQ345_000845 [Seirophora villosa]|nr:MAG: hypothetical protein LQ345_000845 [Seirophora villosa]